MKRFLAAFMLVCGLLVAGGANAAGTVTFTETGGNVVVTFSGSINTAALTANGTNAFITAIAPSFALVNIGDNAATTCSSYLGLNGPTSWGSGGITNTSSVSGDKILIYGAHSELCVPVGYAGGNLSGTSTYNATTIATLGFTVGTYTYTWGSGATADSINLYIGTSPNPTPTPSAVPTLSEWAQLMLGLMVISMLGWQWRKQQN